MPNGVKTSDIGQVRFQAVYADFAYSLSDAQYFFGQNRSFKGTDRKRNVAANGIFCFLHSSAIAKYSLRERFP